MPDYHLTPASGSSPTVVLYAETMPSIPRRQQHEVERHDNVTGTPSSDTAGLNPGDIQFQGRWFGDKAETIATTFRDDFLDDIAVERVDVQAVDSGGNDVSDALNGTYRIADGSAIDRAVAQSGNHWEYNIILIED